MPKVNKFYVCNRQRCGEKCSYPQCKHTNSLYFAKYKENKREWLIHTYSDGSKLLIEKEKNNG